MTTHSNYNDIPYKSLSFTHCQPERLHALAKMKGLNPADLEHAKVLEIGCSYGGNLIPFAIRHPKSTLIGIDLAERQISVGQELMQVIGLDNVQLVAADISQVAFDALQFDYIICHGVFSWVPHSVQEAILRLIQTNLAPNGVAFISYNVYPGWHANDIAKTLAHMASDANRHPFERIDQLPPAFAQLQAHMKANNISSADNVAQAGEHMMSAEKFYVAHEYFETHNHPLWFHQFADQIGQYGLGYLCDSSVPNWQVTTMSQPQLFEQICQQFGNDLVKVEQYMDLITNHQFRTSLITHQSNLQGYDAEHYALCSHFYDLYLFADFEEGEFDGAPCWKTKGENPIHIKKDTIEARVAEALDASSVPLKFADLLDFATSDSERNSIQDLLFILAHKDISNIGFSPRKATAAGKRPKLNPKYHRLIQVVAGTPDVTGLSDQYARGITIDPFLVYAAAYLNGENSVADLVKIMQQAFKNEELVYLDDGKPAKASKAKVETMVKECIAYFERQGFFSEYE